MPVYAHCFHCGHDFESNGYNFQGSVGTQVVGVQETCPNCGRLARVMEGTFSLIGPEVTIHSAPTWSRELIFRLSSAQTHKLRTTAAWARQQLAESDADAERTATTLEKTIEVNAPIAMGWLTRVREEFTGNLSGWASFLVALIALLVMLGQQGVSADDLERILDERLPTAPAEPHSSETEAPAQGPESPPPAP